MRHNGTMARCSVMVIKVNTTSEKPVRGGHFTDVTDALLPLFTDPDGRGSRRWREMFGLERPVQRKQHGAFISRGALRLSSG